MPAAIENGSVFVNLKLADGSYLYDHFDEGFQVVYMGGGQGPQVAPESLRQEVSVLRAIGRPVTLHVLGSADAAVEPHGDHVAYQVAAEVLRQRYAVKGGEVYVIRPDQHVSARWQQYAWGCLSQYIGQLPGSTGHKEN
jgi:3-(3-hydroxy-phenyl)propionate hydroxylase